MVESKKDSIGSYMAVLLGYLIFCMLLPQLISALIPGEFFISANTVYITACCVTGLLFIQTLYRGGGEAPEFKKNLDFKGIAEALGMGVVLFLVINFVVSPLLAGFLQESHENYERSVRIMFETPVAAFFQTVILAPFLEEMIFRGYLLKRSLRWRSAAQSVILVAVFFGLLHLSLLQGLSATAAGMILCLFYVWKRSVSLCIICHSFYNLLAYLMVFHAYLKLA